MYFWCRYLNLLFYLLMDILSEHTENLFPACRVELPASAKGKRAAFYLAAEEYIAKHLPEDTYLFTWKVSNTVVMGRHQDANAEIDIDFCRANGIDIIRRKSGGGCIFADDNNIMISLVTGAGAVEPLFKVYANKLAGALQEIGVNAEVSGRNDILLDGKKISGNAFYHLSQRNIVHGTLLYSTQSDLMSGALCPNPEKMKSHGVKSVKSRVALLKDILTIDIDQLEAHLLETMTDRTIRLTEEDIHYIKSIEADYYDPEYLFRKKRKNDIVLTQYIKGCGEVTLAFALLDGRVEQVQVEGDYFEECDANFTFNEAFKDVEFTQHELERIVEEMQPYRCIQGLNRENLIQILAQAVKKLES